MRAISLSCLRGLLLWSLLFTLNPAAFATPSAQEREQLLSTMKAASRFMLDKASYRGGFVWSYLPDFSRQWGELEARRTMVWMQPPGTATVGHLFLDAYNATGDDFYYAAAEKVAGAIIWAQHPSGGWNYVADFAGEAALQDWYASIGKHAWRLEEFQHYYGNATFDDGGTAEAAQFLLRLYLAKLDPKYRPPLYRALEFVLASQYPSGGWPQRFPLRQDHPTRDWQGKPQADYTGFITFNDDVAAGNIDFLLMCYQTLGEQRVKEPIIRAMNAYLITQWGPPQPGWALQYTPELQPAGARSYEPKSLHIPTTAGNIRELLKFYRLTGERKFLARIPEALDWLELQRYAPGREQEGREYPSFIELDTGKALYTHRRGSNIANGEYYVDYTPGNMLEHYKSAARVDLAGLRQLYAQVAAMPPAEASAGSPLLSRELVELPRYFTLGNINVSDLNFRAQASQGPGGESPLEAARALVASLSPQGYWLSPLYYTTNPYRGQVPAKVAQAGRGATRYANTMVGDAWDTSPYPAEQPVMGISTGVFIRNMGTLIRALDANKAQ